MTRIRSARWAQAGLASAAIAVWAVSSVPATAEPSGGEIVVHGMAFPSGTGIAHLGCDDPFGAAGPATPYVGTGPDHAPAGQRSLGFDLAGGDAVGPVAYTPSLRADATASVAVHAAQGTSGVAWIGLRDAADPAGLVWFGRAAISVAGGGWSRVSTAGLSLEWAQYDVMSGARVGDGPTGSVPSMLAEHGDGAGMVALTLGCDGAPFSVDAWQVGGRNYDFEGLQTSMAIRGQDQSLVAGQATTVRGDLGLVGAAPVPHATAVLERRTDDGWQTVRVVDVAADGAVSAIVEPSLSTTYRWRFVDRPLAAGSTSPTYVVDVAHAVEAHAGARAVTGRIVPGDAGVAVSLRRAGSDEVVATGTTTADGAFSFPTDDVPNGRYVVRAAATDVNLRGESAVVEVDDSTRQAGDPADPAGSAGAGAAAADGPEAEPSRGTSDDQGKDEQGKDDKRPGRGVSASPSAEPSSSPTHGSDSGSGPGAEPGHPTADGPAAPSPEPAGSAEPSPSPSREPEADSSPSAGPSADPS